MSNYTATFMELCPFDRDDLPVKSRHSFGATENSIASLLTQMFFSNDIVEAQIDTLWYTYLLVSEF